MSEDLRQQLQDQGGMGSATVTYIWPILEAALAAAREEGSLAGEVRKIHPEPGDIVVVRLDGPMEVHQAEAVVRQLHELLPEGVRSVVVDSRGDVDIVKARAGTYPVIHHEPEPAT